VELHYQYAQGEAPTLSISKSGPGVVGSGDVFTYQITIAGTNPANISGSINITDILPSEFVLLGPITGSTGISNTNGQTVTWSFDPPDSPSTFSETLTYLVRAITTTGGVCGASLIVENDAEAFAVPTCPDCAPFHPIAQVRTAIENNEGVFPALSTSGSWEACGDDGFTIVNSYLITGSPVVTWTGAVFTEALGTDIGGEGALTGTTTFLMYRAGSLSVTVNGIDYTGVLTPVTTTEQLIIDLSPLQVAGAPTQNLTLLITYTVEISEGSLGGLVERTFYDWSQLFLPNFGDVGICAGNNSFNQVIVLTIGRGDLSVGLSPQILDKCSTNPVVISVNDNTPGRLTDHIVVTFTSSTTEVQSARNFTYTGSLASIGSPTVISVPDIGGGLGIIAFTFPVADDIEGDGEIRFEVDVNCTDEAGWNAGITFQSHCAFTHGDTANLGHIYRVPNLILFATPIRYSLLDGDDVMWKFFVTNNGNLTATNVLITNTINGLSVITYTPDSHVGISISPTVPITDPDPVVFTIDELGPNEQRAITVTAIVSDCEPLSVIIDAELGCFGTVCNQPQAVVDFDTPPPYLLTNNGETADLPMCDLGEVIFTVKNASSDVFLKWINITETLIALTPEEPITMTVFDDAGNLIASTTAFTPEIVTGPGQTVLIWKAISATTEVMTWFHKLPPLYVIRIFVPVRTSCVPPDVPQSFAAADALGPCGKHLGYVEDAVTLNTLQPDMGVIKVGRVAGGDFGETIYAAPGQTVTWRIRVYNNPTSRSYVAQNVVLSDTWPSNFDFITATLGFTPTIITATRTITWNIGDMAPQVAPLEFFITGTVVMTGDACSGSTENRTRLTYGCDHDGCTSTAVPMDTAHLYGEPSLTVTLSPDPLPVCMGDIPITVRNYGVRAYSATLTVTLPSGYVYSHTVSSGLTLTQIISDAPDYLEPQFKWDVIPGRTGSAPYEFTLVLRVRNSGSSGDCPVADGQPVTATLGYDNHAVCTTPGPLVISNTVDLDVLTPYLEVVKSPRTQTIDVGEAITWTITITNTGDGIAENVVITDVAGSNYHSVTATVGSDGSSPTVVGGVVTWTLPHTIPVDDVWTATVSAVLSNTGYNRNVVTATAYCATGCETAFASDTAYTTLLREFEKNPPVQTGTIGSLVVFTFTSFLPDVDALYEDLTITDTLPIGLGYVTSTLVYTYDIDSTQVGPVISGTPTITPGWLQSGNVVWALGDISGTVQINGVLTAVIQNTSTNQSGVRLTNALTMTYTDDGQPYVYTDTADVDVLEPVLHIGKSYVTPYGCEATLFQDNFNDVLDGQPPGGWSRAGTWWVYDGVLRNTVSGFNRRAFAGDPTWTDYSFSFMVRTADPDTAIGAYVRQNDSGTVNIGYQLYWTTSSMRLRSRSPNVNLGASIPFGFETNRWYHVEIQVVGNQMHVFVDGVLRLSRTDADNYHPVGRIGLFSHQNIDTEFDDILVTRLDDVACTVGANDLVTYTLVVSNQARLPGYDLVISDALPGGMSLVTYTMESDDPASAVTAEPALIPGATGVLTWGVNQLMARVPFDPVDHTALTLTVVLRVSDGIMANIVLPNQASLSYDNWEGSSQPTSIDRDYSGGSHSAAVRTVNGGLVKTVAFGPPPTATLGSLVTYTLIIPAPPISATLYGVVVTDTVHLSMTIASVITAGGTGGLYDVSGRVVTATFASIPHDTQAHVTITARISDELGAYAGYVITNVAVMTHATSSEITTTEVVSTFVGEPELALVKESTPPTSNTVGAGDSVTYTITITNWSGPDASPAYDVVFTDTLPEYVRDAAPTLITVTLDGAPVAPSLYITGYNATTGVFTVVFTSTFAFSIPVDGALVIEYVATVDDDVGAGLNLSNYAEVTWSSLPGATPGDRDYAPVDGDTTVHTVLPSLVKTLLFGPVPTNTIGSLITYTIIVPAPPITATIYNAVVTDTLDSRLGVVTVTATGGTTPRAGWSGQTVTATFASIPHDTQAHVTITARISDELGAYAGYVITNVAVMTHATSSEITTTEVVSTPIVEPSLTLVKASGPPISNIVEAGESVTYTVRITNSSAITVSPAYDIFITDTLPAHVTLFPPIPVSLEIDGSPVAASDFVSSYVGGVLTLDLDDAISIPVGGVLTLIYHGRVDADVPAGEDQINLAEVTWSSLAGDVPGDRDYGPITGTTNVHAGVPDLVLVKFADPNPVEAGGYLTYTLAVTNTGIVSATGVVITDVVPVNTTFVTATLPHTGPVPDPSAGSVISWHLGIMDVDESHVVTMVVQMDSPLPDGTPIVNTAWVTSSEGITDTDTVTTPVESSHVLTLTKTADPDPVQAGGLLTYTLAWEVGGNETALDVTISDTTPASTTFWAASPPTTTTPVVGGTGLVVWSLGSISPTATGVVTMVVRVDSPLVSGTLLYNAAIITDSEGITATDEITTPVESWHDLIITKTAEPSPVEAGALLTYTIEWQVAGNEPALDVTISDTTPTSTTFWAASPPTTTTPVVGGTGPVVWSLGDQNPPASGVVTMVVLVDSPLLTGTVLYNAAFISDTQGITDTDDITTPVTSWHNLIITKTAIPSPVAAGTLLTYTLAWSVTGNEPALGVTISDTVPQSTTYQTCNGGLFCGQASGVVTWYLNTVSPPASGVVTMVVLVDSPLLTDTVLYNAVFISDTQGITDTDEITTLVRSWHALTVTKQAEPSPVAAGALLTYTIEWQVAGNEPALDVTISDTTPTSTTFWDAIPLADSDPGVGGTGLVVWFLGTQNPPLVGVLTGVVTMVVRVDSAVLSGTDIYNAVIITDTQGITGTDDITTPVEALTDLTVVKTDSHDPVIPGTLLTYTLVVTNNGPSDADNVVVTDTLPPEVSFVTATTPVTVALPDLAWPLGTMTVGAVRRLTVTVRVYVTTTEVFTNFVVVDSETPDDNPDDNDDDEPTTPLVPGLEVVKAVAPDEVVPNMPFTYTIRITNTGQVTFDPLVLTDTLPAEFHYVAFSGTPTDPDSTTGNVSTGLTLAWQNLGSLNPGVYIDVSFAVTVTPGITGTYWNVATATGTTPTGVVTDTDDAPVAIDDPAVVVEKRVVAIDRENVLPQRNLITFTIAITNVGPSSIGVLPLVDHYDYYYLGFERATVSPDTVMEDPVSYVGILTWDDLTRPAPNGFGRDLPPGEAFFVTTVFYVNHDINITTTNVATVTDVVDTYDNPVDDDDDEEDIGGEDDSIPTPVELLYFRAVAEEEAVRLEWATAAEVGAVGFYVYRAQDANFDGAQVMAYVPATGSGSTYSHADRDVTPDQTYWYWLAEVGTAGSETLYGPVQGGVGIDSLPYRLYLPLVLSADVPSDAEGLVLSADVPPEAKGLIQGRQGEPDVASWLHRPGPRAGLQAGLHLRWR